MSSVLPKVRDDAVCARKLGDHGSGDRIGFAAFSRLP
jgi:hypothetical protein